MKFYREHMQGHPFADGQDSLVLFKFPWQHIVRYSLKHSEHWSLCKDRQQTEMSRSGRLKSLCKFYSRSKKLRNFVTSF